MFKAVVFIIFLAINNFSQTVDPLDFFPSAVGNVWEYGGGEFGEGREEIYKDSVDNDGLHYIYYKYDDSKQTNPRYKIDTLNRRVYRLNPYNPNDTHRLYYQLDADTGESWVVRVEYLNDTLNLFSLAKVTAVYQGYFYNHFTTFKEITYYNVQWDSTLNEQSWPEKVVTLAAGIGLILQVWEDGTPQIVFKGCIINGDTIGVVTSVKDISINPDNFNLSQNYPNPFNPATTIEYAIKDEGFVKLTVYSPLGEEVKILVNEYQKKGTYEVGFNAGDLPSGVYIYKIIAGKSSASKKMLLLK